MEVRTIRDLMEAARACTTKDEARELVRQQAAEIEATDPLMFDEKARQIVLSNIGYITGYLDRAEAARILELFGARHPYFGAIEDWPKTPEETVELGFKAGQAALRRSTVGRERR